MLIEGYKETGIGSGVKAQCMGVGVRAQTRRLWNDQTKSEARMTGQTHSQVDGG